MRHAEWYGPSPKAQQRAPLVDHNAKRFRATGNICLAMVTEMCFKRMRRRAWGLVTMESPPSHLPLSDFITLRSVSG